MAAEPDDFGEGSARAVDSAAPPIPVEPSYNKLSENFRKMTPQEVLCSMFCGGRKCKYETWKDWKMDDMAIDAIYSHWITSDILAMARPNTEVIREKNIIGQFLKNGIKTVINLQMPGEHSKCGPPLEPSGFAYNPEVFMENGIYYYNFGWKDYGESTLQGLLNVVKVVAFAVSQGKVAIHCHAGLGRTGVLISCYLVYALRVRANDAIRYVRKKRSHAVQTRSQIMCVQEFEHFLMPYFRVFCIRDYMKEKDMKNHPDFTLAQHLADQNVILHGYESRALRYIPKIVYVICERLLNLCQASDKAGPSSINFRLNAKNLPFTRRFVSSQYDSEQSRRLPYVSNWRSASVESAASSASSVGKVFRDDLSLTSSYVDRDLASWKSETPSELSHSGTLEDLLDNALGDNDISSSDFKDLSYYSNLYLAISSDTARVAPFQVLEALLASPDKYHDREDLLKTYKLELNGRISIWCRLASETDLFTLSALLWDWLLHLKLPILTFEELSFVVVYASNPKFCLSKFDQATRYLIEYLAHFVSRLMKTLTVESVKLYRENLLKRIIAALTQQGVATEDYIFPPGSKKLGQGTLTNSIEFFVNLMDLIGNIAWTPQSLET